MAQKVFAIRLQKADEKELADGKDMVCHQPALCRPPADGKGSKGQGRTYNIRPYVNQNLGPDV